MKLEKNSVIGMVLLAGLFIAYFYFTRQGQIELEMKQQRIRDSLAALVPQVKDTAVAASASVDIALQPVASAGGFVQMGSAVEEFSVLENERVRVTFSNKGGRPVSVELKNYVSRDSSQVKLIAASFNQLSYPIQIAANETAFSGDLFFSSTVADASGKNELTYRLSDSSGRSIVHQFSLSPDEYMISWKVKVQGADKLFTGSSLNMLWQVQADQQEMDIQTEKRETQLGLYGPDGFDYFTMSDGLNEKWDEGLKWLGVKQKFFNTTIISESGFSRAEINCTVPDDSLGIVAQTVANLKVTLPAGKDAEVSFRMYMGPNDYKILKSYGLDLEDMVNLGQGFYAFVKYINRWIVLPVFDFFQRYVSSLGLAIALLTLFIRLLTSPLVYTSYLSGAKMKAMRPELDVLKAKYGDDQQSYSMEQMKLFRSAGVNPLGGCIPALLQIPIFFALYSFFNSNISLRGQSFWWAKDLSSYDAILTWDFYIPGVGSHLSLFTLLSVITSLLISLYSMSMTPDQNNPVLKYMPYIFPVLLLGIFNGLPSALTWYYTVSNVITLLLQFVIQNYIIDHEKIMVEIETNKKKPREKSKWQERLEQMQETQKKVKALQDKSKKK
ncbi:MAG: membrane protein insertase YidC [Bacteroidota bacterium]